MTCDRFRRRHQRLVGRHGCLSLNWLYGQRGYVAVTNPGTVRLHFVTDQAFVAGRRCWRQQSFVSSSYFQLSKRPTTVLVSFSAGYYIQSLGLFSCSLSLSPSVSLALMLTLSISNPATLLYTVPIASNSSFGITS